MWARPTNLEEHECDRYGLSGGTAYGVKVGSVTALREFLKTSHLRAIGMYHIRHVALALRRTHTSISEKSGLPQPPRACGWNSEVNR